MMLKRKKWIDKDRSDSISDTEQEAALGRRLSYTRSHSRRSSLASSVEPDIINMDNREEKLMNFSDNESISSRKTLKRRNSFQDAKVANKRLRDSRRFIFFLGAFLGVCLAAYFGSDHVHSNNIELFDNLVNFENVKDYIDDWKDILPQGFTAFLTDVQTGYAASQLKDMGENFAVGRQLAKEMDLHAKHPVVMIPGVISTGIESWGVNGDEQCDSAPHFRKRLWGSFYMLKSMVMDKACWLKHVCLDPVTGLDPENFKLRAVQGFESSDFFITGYWIWNKILQNLGAIGYEPDTMVTASYDWRLAYLDLERRDQYFSKLKQQIELFYALTGEKSTLVGHSMGSQVLFYFLQWVEAEGPGYGNAGEGWVDTYISSFVNVAGTLLGAPKAVPALISGEMKDTIQLNALAMYGLEKFFSRKERVDMLQTWGGIPSMLPKGGDLIWGNMSFSSEDELHNNTDTFGNFIRFEQVLSNAFEKNLTMSDAIDLIETLSPPWLVKRMREQYSYGYATTEAELQENKKHHSHWANPLEVPLPNAPNMKMYCIYGTDNPTERAYVYRENHANDTSSLNLTIDYDSDTPVFLTNGDGTVPIMSHAMCHKWAQGQSAYNPAGINVTVIEIKHEPDRFDIRGGAKTADHVDILGSAELNEYILKIAGGYGDTIPTKVHTNMTKWVENINFPLS